MMYLRNHADIRTLCMLSFHTVCLGLMLLFSHRSMYVILLLSFLSFISCIIKHNHMHCTVFERNDLNGILGVWLALLTGTSSIGIIQAHNIRHHGALNSKEDFVRTDLVRFKSPLLNLCCFPFVSIVTMMKERESDFSYWRARDERRHRQILREVYAIWILVSLIALHSVSDAVLILLLPWLIAQIFLVAVNYLQHDACDTDSELLHSRNVTGRIMNWFFFNNGFHTAHHLKPGLHWSKLPEYHFNVLEDAMPSRLNYRSLFGLIWHNYIRWEGAKSGSN